MVSDAYRFVLPLFAAAAAGAFLGYTSVALLCLFLAAFVCYFFRNPDREIPAGDNIVVSPADGRVVKIAQITAPNGEKCGHGISIFLNIFNVHVNRSPIAGKLERIEYKRGRFKAAFADEASHVNEQNVLTIRGQRITVTVRQIAGLIARRVVCWKEQGHAIERGELIGLIRFGSRVDIELPREVKVVVKVGDHVRGGSSILGMLP